MQGKTTNRSFDTQQESTFTKWLDTYFFKRNFTDSDVITDKEMQVAGIDVICDGVNYDIKSQTNKKYLNNPRNTFSMEISFLNKRGEESIGWFINSRLETERYFFVWVPECDHIDGKIIDVYKVEIMSVDKSTLVDGIMKEFLEHNKGDIFDFANAMRIAGDEKVWIGGLKFVCSNHLFEEPVNIILSKDTLKKYSNGHWIVTKNSITNI